MARGKGIPASHALEAITVSYRLGAYPEVAKTLAARAALRALPLIVAEWERPGFEVLPFFRIAQATWTFLKTPNDITSAAVRAALQPISVNSNAGSAVTQAAAATLPRNHSNVGEFAERAIGAAARADSAIADDTLEDLRLTDHGSSYTVRGKAATKLASTKLWQGETAHAVADAWALLKSRMLLAGEGWEVWVDWYEDRLYGRPSLGEAFDIALATLPDDVWKQGPKAVNTEIRRLIEAHTPAEPIPAQGAGPHFALGPDLKIALVPPAEIDPAGNNLRRIREQLPLVRQVAGDLAGHLNPNTQPEISRNLADYRTAIAGEPETIAWGIVFGLGVRLENAASAARREISNRMQEPLEDPAQEALESFVTLHGPLILATKEGRELSDEADRFRLSRGERDALQKDAERLSERLRNAPNIVEPAVIDVTVQAADAIGDGSHSERGTAYWLATAKNIATILVPAGGLGALAHSMGGIGEDAILLTAALLFHENQRLREAARVIGADYHRVLDAALDTAKDQADLAKAQAVARLRLLTPFLDFVIANEEPLRRMVAYSTNLRWMLWYIDFIVRTNGETRAAVPQVLTSIKIVPGEPS
jgi:hypothetical protein